MLRVSNRALFYAFDLIWYKSIDPNFADFDMLKSICSLLIANISYHSVLVKGHQDCTGTHLDIFNQLDIKADTSAMYKENKFFPDPSEKW